MAVSRGPHCRLPHQALFRVFGACNAVTFKLVVRILTSGRLFEKFFGPGCRKNYEHWRDAATAPWSQRPASPCTCVRPRAAWPRPGAGARVSHQQCRTAACRIHGGLSPGAPSGKGNGMWRHGRFSRETIELRRAMRKLMRDAKETLAALKANHLSWPR
jgi:hypothetical protein